VWTEKGEGESEGVSSACVRRAEEQKDEEEITHYNLQIIQALNAR